MDRVQRVFLVTGNCCDRPFLAAEHPDLIVAVVGSDAGSQALLRTLPAIEGAVPAAAGRLYLIAGNVLLSYSATAPDMALLADVKKLLQLSHIG